MWADMPLHVKMRCKNNYFHLILLHTTFSCFFANFREIELIVWGTELKIISIITQVAKSLLRVRARES